MKNIVLFFAFILTLSIYSCDKESGELNLQNEKEVQNLTEESNGGFDSKVLKSFEIWSRDREVGVKVNVLNASYQLLSPKDITIEYLNIDANSLTNTNVAITNATEHNTDNEPSSITFEFIKVPDNAIKVKFNVANIPKTGERGIVPENWDFYGRYGTCGQGGTRIRGFLGDPDDCDHTHWYLKKKKESSTWFWDTIYEGTSFNENTFINYLDLQADYYLWRVRQDPDQDCNSYAPFDIILSGC